MRVKKKGQAGQAKNFLTRTQAVRKLQISLPDFRRLCIFKGIYPREPRNNRKASKSSTASTTFYYTKDIQYLLHEPLLSKFRDHKSLSKKIARSLGRGEIGDAARLEKRGATKLSLDHIIKERYPSFVDALRDLDDALSLLFLFANLPSTSTVPTRTIALCQRLCFEFQHYLITTNSLRKSFLSIKGIYYQATIQGQDVLWLVPYKFVQRVTGDVDFRIMGTFVEFYTTLLGFVNFRLYNSIGLVYPPRFDSKRDEQGAELNAFTLEGRGIEENGTGNEQLENNTIAAREIDEETQNKIANLPTEEEQTAVNADVETPNAAELSTVDATDTFTAIAADADILPQPQSSTEQLASLFAPHTFYISRECPRAPLEFLLRAFGCKRVGWDTVLGPGAFTHDETDQAITHQIVDRPPITVSVENAQIIEDSIASEKEKGSEAQGTRSVRPGYRVPGRTYIQPQWVWDSINEVKCLRPDLYAPGATLPPHLSPWVKPSKDEYDPRVPLAEQEVEGEAVEDEEEDVIQTATNGDTADHVGLHVQIAKESEEDIETTSPTETKTHLNSNATTDESHGMTISTASASDSDSNEETFIGFTTTTTTSINSSDDNDNDNSDDDDDEDDEDDPSLLHQKELEAEAAGLPYPAGRKADGTPLKSILKSSNATAARERSGRQTTAAIKRQRREEEEEVERRKGMLGNRKRKLFEKMVFSNQSKEGEARRLRGKRRRVEREREGKSQGGLRWVEVAGRSGE